MQKSFDFIWFTPSELSPGIRAMWLDFFVTVCSLVSAQILDVDREGLTKLKKAVKALNASGNGNFSHLDKK